MKRALCQIAEANWYEYEFRLAIDAHASSQISNEKIIVGTAYQYDKR